MARYFVVFLHIISSNLQQCLYTSSYLQPVKEDMHIFPYQRRFQRLKRSLNSDSNNFKMSATEHIKEKQNPAPKYKSIYCGQKVYVSVKQLWSAVLTIIGEPYTIHLITGKIISISIL